MSNKFLKEILRCVSDQSRSMSKQIDSSVWSKVIDMVSLQIETDQIRQAITQQIEDEARRKR